MSKIYALDSLQRETLPSPLAVTQELPASLSHLQFIKESRNQIINILNGKDDRLLLIVGPCSIHDIKAAKEYAKNLQGLAEEVSKSFFIVMRAYFEKPRTALGWKGMLYDPHLDGSNDIATGIRSARKLLIDLADIQVPAATEFLDPISPHFLSDLISWSCIGARTTESQVHRQFASGLPMPVAFKNNTSGNVNVAVKGALTATSSHTFFGINHLGVLSTVTTKGNPHAHIALRGGEQAVNYDSHSIKEALKLLKKNHLKEGLIIDCSHDNSNRCHEEQKSVFKSVIHQRINGNAGIRGLALESNLFAGNQPIPFDKSKLQYAVSLTDPCLDWKETEILIRWGAALLKDTERGNLADLVVSDHYANYSVN